MARLTIEKYFAGLGEYWTNIYWTDGTISEAGSALAAIIAAERALYYPTVTITKARVDDGVPNTDVFVTSVINQAGTRAASSDPLPLFAVARVDFSIAGQGRPGRKYLRGVLQENDTASFNIVSGLLTSLQTYADAVVAAGVTDEEGQAFSSGAPALQVGMRQLRRGSKKKITP